MTTDPLLARVRELWEELASAPVSFPPEGRVSVVVSPGSLMCPDGWVGYVVLGESAIATAPGPEIAAALEAATTGRSVHALVDEIKAGKVLPVASVLGPAALAYVSETEFRRYGAPDRVVEQLPVDHADVRAFEQSAGEEDAGESGLAQVTSPVFAIREGGVVVAASGYQLWPCRTAHVSVLTAPLARGKGLAKATGAAAVAHALEAGLLPQWRARLIESRRAARALGFLELGVQLAVKLELEAADEATSGRPGPE